MEGDGGYAASSECVVFYLSRQFCLYQSSIGCDVQKRHKYCSVSVLGSSQQSSMGSKCSAIGYDCGGSNGCGGFGGCVGVGSC